MANIDILRSKVKFHIRDIKTLDMEINDIILQVINDIANETKIFRKIIGFTIHKDKCLYDFRNILRMNEQVETEVESIVIGDIPRQDLIDFMLDATNFPNPNVEKVLYTESEQSRLLNVLDIFDNEGRSITDYFDYHSTNIYYANNESWLEEFDGSKCAFTASVLPHIDEILEEDIEIISACIIAGSKYYFSDTLQSATDAQVANVFYQRYWTAKQALINQFPTQIISTTSDKRSKVWP